MFAITNSRLAAQKITSLMRTFVPNVADTEMAFGYSLIASEGYKTRQIASAQLDSGEAFGFGTFFSENGFWEDALSGLSAELSDSQIRERLYGHYCLVLTTGTCLRLVRDEVGMEDIFYSVHGTDVTVSNSMLLTAVASGHTSMHPDAISQFVFRGATIGRETLFTQVHRLSIDETISLDRNGLMFGSSSFEPKRISLEDYFARIAAYFSLLNNFSGKKTVDASAGYDTRTVAAVSSQYLNKFCFVGNENTSDGGVDAHVGQLMAQQLSKRSHLISMESENIANEVMDDRIFFHDCARDLFAARKTLYLAKEISKYSELQIGGYGGEIIRAKYTNFGTWGDFAREYYGTSVARSLGMSDTFTDSLEPKLRRIYARPFLQSPRDVCRWLYAMDRMRIWGGARNRIRSHRVDSIHPFMDWKLLGPLLVLPFEDLDHGKLQMDIIKRFSAELLEIPINPSPEEIGLRSTSDLSTRSNGAFTKIRKLVGAVKKRGRPKEQQSDPERIKDFLDVYETVKNRCDLQDIKAKTGLDIKKSIEKHKVSAWGERMLTCLASLNFAKEKK